VTPRKVDLGVLRVWVGMSRAMPRRYGDEDMRLAVLCAREMLSWESWG